MEPMAGSAGRAPRRDAVENRERILDAAEQVFAERGVHAPLLTIIRKLGIGNGTFYRHFADADELVLALYGRMEERLDEVARRCEDADDGWGAMLEYIDGVAWEMIHRPSSTAVMRRARELRPDEDPGHKYREPLRRMLAHAQSEGRVRPDVVPTDLAGVPIVLASWMAQFPPEMQASFYPRARALLLAGFTNLADESLPGPAIGADLFRDLRHGAGGS